jgi:small subunit ribosomal protein S6
MNKYESVVIINPTVDEEGMKALISKFTDLINNDGKVEKVDELGKRKLAYDVKNVHTVFLKLIFMQLDVHIVLL